MLSSAKLKKGIEDGNGKCQPRFRGLPQKEVLDHAT